MTLYWLSMCKLPNRAECYLSCAVYRTHRAEFTRGSQAKTLSSACVKNSDVIMFLQEGSLLMVVTSCSLNTKVLKQM